MELSVISMIPILIYFSMPVTPEAAIKIWVLVVENRLRTPWCHQEESGKYPLHLLPFCLRTVTKWWRNSWMCVENPAWIIVNHRRCLQPFCAFQPMVKKLVDGALMNHHSCIWRPAISILNDESDMNDKPLMKLEN